MYITTAVNYISLKGSTGTLDKQVVINKLLYCNKINRNIILLVIAKLINLWVLNATPSLWPVV